MVKTRNLLKRRKVNIKSLLHTKKIASDFAFIYPLRVVYYNRIPYLIMA
jgi:hypothetical protein